MNQEKKIEDFLSEFSQLSHYKDREEFLRKSTLSVENWKLILRDTTIKENYGIVFLPAEKEIIINHIDEDSPILDPPNHPSWVDSAGVFNGMVISAVTNKENNV